MLSSRWSVSLGREWITSLAALDTAGSVVLVGDRDGRLHAVDQHGNVLCKYDLDSWIGALAVVRFDDQRDLIVAGTKRGSIDLLELVRTSSGEYLIESLASTKARNTVRSASVASDGHGDFLVALGSEDRSVYHFSVMKALREGLEQAVSNIRFNGWIRTTSFCLQAWLGVGPVLAAGCGDKRVHFVDCQRDTIVGEVHCDGKVHAIISSRDNSKVYATSDSRVLFEITYSKRRRSAVISRRISLPFRATRLAFADVSENYLLICSEAGHIVIYDTSLGSTVERLSSSRPIFSALALSQLPGGGLLLGQDNGQLTFAALTRPEAQHDLNLPEAPMPPRILSGDVGTSARGLVRGVTGAGLHVGIGRFVSAPALLGASRDEFIFVSTDEGHLVSVQLLDELSIAEKWTMQPREDVRLWSVAALRDANDQILIFASTSAGTVEIIHWANAEADPVLTHSVDCPDWPRELRPALSEDSQAVVYAGCESGHVIAVASDGATRDIVTGAGTIRSLCLVNEGGDLVVGTDDRHFALFIDESEAWRIECADRVREVIALRGYVIAVSEDHFIYVVTEEGTIVWRLRLPHRLLCITDVSDESSVKWRVAVGCGDGQVYVLDESGTVLDGIEFPDRIRDVVRTPRASLVVTCEDGYVYPALQRNWREDGSGVSERIVSALIAELRSSLPRDGYSALNELPTESVLLLLEHYDYWRGPVDDDLVLACVDRVLAPIAIDRNVSLPYRLAEAIADIALQTDQLAAARIRLTRLVEQSANGSAYPAHAALRAVVSAKQHTTVVKWLNLADGILRCFPLDDPWLREELVRALDAVGFFRLSSRGFSDFLATSRISFARLSRVLSEYDRYLLSGRAVGSEENMDSLTIYPLWRLARTRLRGALDQVRDLVSLLDGLDERSETIDACRSMMLSAVRSPQPVAARVDAFLRRWRDVVGSPELVQYVETAMHRVELLGMDGRDRPGLVADFLEQEVERDDPEVTNSEYTYILAALAVLGALN